MTKSIQPVFDGIAKRIEAARASGEPAPVINKILQGIEEDIEGHRGACRAGCHVKALVAFTKLLDDVLELKKALPCGEKLGEVVPVAELSSREWIKTTVQDIVKLIKNPPGKISPAMTKEQFAAAESPTARFEAALTSQGVIFRDPSEGPLPDASGRVAQTAQLLALCRAVVDAPISDDFAAGFLAARQMEQLAEGSRGARRQSARAKARRWYSDDLDSAVIECVNARSEKTAKELFSWLPSILAMRGIESHWTSHKKTALTIRRACEADFTIKLSNFRNRISSAKSCQGLS